MKRKTFLYLFLFLIIPLTNLFSQFSFEEESSLLDDLLVVNYWNQRLNERFPVTYDHLLQGGYFSMPSARMGQEGEVGFGYGYIHPYIHYNLRIQLVDFLEITGTYRIFKGVDDPVLTPLGFGDFSDKGANVKLSIFKAEDSHYKLPGFAVGFEDFIGTSAFNAWYLVLTQVFLKQDFEVTLGYGFNRIHKWFGGLCWMPFRRTTFDYLKGLSLVMEYDAIPYEDETLEKHPKGRKKLTPWQIGFKYRLWDTVDMSLAYIRGDKVAFTISSQYNFGTCTGFLPKIHDCTPYRAPLNLEPIGLLRSEKELLQELCYAMRGHGLNLSKGWITFDGKKKILQVLVNNIKYKQETQVRERLDAILSSLIPEDIYEVIVTIDTIAMPVHEYRYLSEHLRLYREKTIGLYELGVLTPLEEASVPNVFASKLIFEEKREWWNFELLPKTNTLFGSSRGKFKCALGLSASLNGFIIDDIFYTINLGYFFYSTMKQLNSVDRLNPSQLINVRTDALKYFRPFAVTVDEAYLEKVWNLGRGWYSKLSLGYFEIMYGGVGAECLYYPVRSQWAAGIEVALVKKRTPHGIDFTDRIRKLDGFRAYHKKFIGSQAFLNIYYDWKETELEFKTSIGKFLANDVGARFEISRYFCNGLRIGFWYTGTNGHDVINGQNYHDKGIFFSVPLDIFYTQTSRSRWGYGLSAWLRDVGAKAVTGNQLYDLINQERQGIQR